MMITIPRMVLVATINFMRLVQKELMCPLQIKKRNMDHRWNAY
jgi:hypothetical protein